MDGVYRELEALYGSDLPDSEKLSRREEVFRKRERRLEAIGRPSEGPLNNAVILAHRLYRSDWGLFEAAFERNGRAGPGRLPSCAPLIHGDQPRTFAAA